MDATTIPYGCSEAIEWTSGCDATKLKMNHGGPKKRAPVLLICTPTDVAQRTKSLDDLRTIRLANEEVIVIEVRLDLFHVLK
jgi:hypothetical protein